MSDVRYRGAGGKEKRSCQFWVLLNNCNNKNLSCERKMNPGDFSSQLCWMLLLLPISSSVVRLRVHSKDANTHAHERNMSGQNTEHHKQENKVFTESHIRLTALTLIWRTQMGLCSSLALTDQGWSLQVGTFIHTHSKDLQTLDQALRQHSYPDPQPFLIQCPAQILSLLQFWFTSFPSQQLLSYSSVNCITKSPKTHRLYHT